jgi:hypothetical protein
MLEEVLKNTVLCEILNTGADDTFVISLMWQKETYD